MALRNDGRKFNELRKVSAKLGYIPHAEGSCLFQMDKTKVLCVASVEGRVPPFLAGKGTGWINADYAMLPRAGLQRSPRSKVASGGRAQEIQRLIGRSLRAVVDLEKLGERTIVVDCDVIQADGGTRTASINGAFLAVYQALKYMMNKELIAEWPVKYPVGAVSVGIIEGRPMLDLNYEEDSSADMDMNVVMTGRDGFVELQGTAEHNVFTQKELGILLNLAKKGIREIMSIQKGLIKKL